MNVYENEADREKYLKRYYTEEGKKSLQNRLKSLTDLYIKKKKYPFQAQILGFPMLNIHSKEHHEGMIDNLCQILGIKEIKIEVQD